MRPPGLLARKRAAQSDRVGHHVTRASRSLEPPGERGLKDLDALPRAHVRVRRKGGGRDASLLDGLKGLVESATLGDPMRPLLWVSKSLDKLASALATMGHSVSPNSVRKLRAEIAFSRQVLRKADERASHPDRASDVASQSARGIISRRLVPFGPGWFAILIGRT